MTELTSSIGRFNAKTGTVPVTFTAGDIVQIDTADQTAFVEN